MKSRNILAGAALTVELFAGGSFAISYTITDLGTPGELTVLDMESTTSVR
jgi:hypothetical protein